MQLETPLGTLRRMSSSWSVEQYVREDAESVFVPTGLLPRARAGDVVAITSSEPDVTRHGHITDTVADGERGTFVVVRLDD